MSDIAIRCEHLSKQYRIGERESYKALRDVIADGVASPFRRMRSVLDRRPKTGDGQNDSNGHRSPVSGQCSSATIWALDDVSFEVKRGEVVGIIGRNGAGKSTLLKILSRITKPTKGHAKIYGRVGSLLEVGTGFHPELTGRENIYLNGAILGMRKAEIERKFDEIVAFAEVEKFIDTPVKRYSSGMYVRLAFSVAAHMETEILLVDEVLAVGDTQFQKKCLGKMGDVAQQNRTILFVSHNMAAIRSLCRRALLLRDGKVAMDSDVEAVSQEYLAEDSNGESTVIWDEHDAPQSDEIRFRRAWVVDNDGTSASEFDCTKQFSIKLEYDVLKPLSGLRVGFFMRNGEGIPICGSNDPYAWPTNRRDPGRYISQCTFPGYTLNHGEYSVYFGADIPPYITPLVTTPFCLKISIVDLKGHGPSGLKLPGVARPDLRWEVMQKSTNG
jgi:lipopolysaccharide transport system ATP-binding protein